VNTAETPANGVDDDNNGYVDDYYGWDWVNNDNDPMDDYGHGTHVAGTIGAVGNNGIGVVGVNWNVKIMPVKFLGSTGSGSSFNGAKALIYAADNGARVLNNSWGGPTSSITTDAVNYAHSKNAVLVASAGNSNIDASRQSPANEVNVITVSAFDPNDQKASFSNWGTKIDVAAPGVDILSLKAAVSPMCTTAKIVGTNYCRASGTSMAAPHVSGLAALILAKHPEFSNEDVRQVLRVSADDVDAPGFDFNSGFGRINAARALSVDSVLQVKIINPIALSDLTHLKNVDIIGTAVGTGFVDYQITYGVGLTPSEWSNPIVISSSPVVDGLLGIWNVGSLEPNIYTLMLEARDEQGFRYISFLRVFKEKDTVPLITNPSAQLFPSVSGNKIVWQDDRNGNWDIYLYDLDTNEERQITHDKANHFLPDISGNKIVWQDHRNNPAFADIYLYDLTTNTERRITSQPHFMANGWIINKTAGPAISGNKIVWAAAYNFKIDYTGSDELAIHLYDLTTNTERQVNSEPESPYQTDAWMPDIFGNLVVGLDTRDLKFDIYLYDLTTNTERQVNKSLWAMYPAISGNKIVWHDFPPELDLGTNYLYDLTTNTQRQIPGYAPPYGFSGLPSGPAISGNKIVWADNRNGEWDIYVYDSIINTEQRITYFPGDEMMPAISGGKIVWVDDRNGNPDIYLYEIPGVEQDSDSDEIVDSKDNCPTVANPDQKNTDAAPIPTGRGSGPDSTVPNADNLGDACDTDDDNDGLADSAETTAGANPLKPDSDYDGVLDGFEVANGSNPLDKKSKPPFSSLTERQKDNDGDFVADWIEVRGWGTSPSSIDSDGDRMTDAVEIYDVNGDKTVNILDSQLVAKAANLVAPFNTGPLTPEEIHAYDVNRDGVVNISDVFLVAKTASRSPSCSIDNPCPPFP
jgi:beta propeller repeat protein